MILLTWLNIALTLKCSLDTEIERKKTWLALHHLTFEIICPANIMIVAIYWSLIHPERMKDPYFSENSHILFAVSINHSSPLTFNLINFYLTDVIIAAKHWKPLLPIGIVYLGVNYVETMKSGEPLYPFLTWEPTMTTVATVIGLILFPLGNHLLLAWITRSIKRGSSRVK